IPVCSYWLFTDDYCLPPTFVKKMEPKLMWKQGIAARMQCTVKGSAELKASWFLNDKELSDGDKYKITFKAGLATLEIIDVNVLDSGNYTCEVSNKPPSLRKELQMVETVKGAPAVLECEIKGTAPFEITWFKNKKPVVATDKKYKIVSQESIARLEFCSFESADIGDYQCCIANDVEPPSFVRKIENVNSLVGSEISMQCTLKGSLPMTVSWLKDDHEVKDGEHVQMSFEDRTALLCISNIQTKHAGKYTCQAKNEAGNKSSVLNILRTEKSDSGDYNFEVSNDVGSSTCEATVSVLGQLIYTYLKIFF
uniref:Ig-like domain-containing protein n=1 Tax=Hucho hucho TaxID=62062 RepID=A0A4W5NUB2_9TELE